ncbi:Ca2+ activated outward rectifying K+ channel 5 [Prunus dulcis]|uniref:Ca2+ activated outward rectifying K+ channel 5 n=1 Tax=Prunus dulcis TaxID=3755 RepID=A0A4Y1QP09_PRUDU|nr:Ca2+ activated outward rectifying K+ channel 5 [Prunus dulcis]
MPNRLSPHWHSSAAISSSASFGSYCSYLLLATLRQLSPSCHSSFQPTLLIWTMEIKEDIGDQSSGGGSGVNLQMPLLRPSTLGSGVGEAALKHIQAAQEHIQDAALLQQDVAQYATLLPQDIPRG